jgi:glycopeptide antibiotics resistance protein
MAANKKHRLQWVCFGAYLLFLSYLLFFSNYFGRTGQTEEYRYNLTLFLEIGRYYGLAMRTGKWAPFLINVCGNVAVFIPVGIFLPTLIKKCKNLIFTGLISLEISLVVEIIQIVTRVGSFDVDDLLLNTLGGVVGYLIFVWRTRNCCRKGK